MLSLLLVASLQVAAGQNSSAPAQPSMLVLGSPHLANNNRDVVATAVEDVLTAERQREILRLVESLARYRPTRIAVEWRTTRQADLDKRYADYRAGTYELSANEIDQIGLRLAARLNLPRLEAVDWNEAPPMPEESYDWSAYAASHGLQSTVDSIRLRGQQLEQASATERSCTDIAGWYRAVNSQNYRAVYHRRYFEYAGLGDNQINPGATWVGLWYTRNLRIFANLSKAAANGDRVLVLYGAGHGYLLDQFAKESGRFRSEDPLEFLPEGVRRQGAGCS